MNRKNSITARIAAALALVASIAVVIAVVSATTGGDGDTSRPKSAKTKQNGNVGKQEPATRKKVYVVKEGDTLTVIAVDTGVSIEQIEKLNPTLDPQALIPGQKLKLR